MRQKYLIITLSIVLTCCALAHTATAADTVAIVSIKKILEESKAAKNINEQIEEKREEFQEEVSEEEETLREEDQELAEQRTVLSKEVFEQRAKEFRTKLVDAQRGVQLRRTRLENAYVKAMAEVREVTLDIIGELAKEKGFAVALPKSQVLYSKESLDISEEVLDLLNDRLPEVEVVVEEG